MATLQPSILELDKDISKLQDVLSSLPKSHPDRFASLCNLAMTQLRRHDMSHDEQDLDKSILRFTQAIFHPCDPVTKDWPNPIEAFFFLTDALLHRTLMSRPPVASNIKYCIEYFYYLRDLSLEAFGVARDDVTALLVRALSLQIRSGSVDVMTSLKRMTVLCRELLTSDELTGYLPLAIKTLASVVSGLVGLESDTQSLDQLIDCLCEANVRLPDFHGVPYAPSYCLFMRFNATKSNDDYDDAIAILDKIIASHSSADDPDLRSRTQTAAGLAATLAHSRFYFYGKPDYLQEAIFRRRAHFNALSLEDPERLPVSRLMTDLERERFDEFGVKNADSEARSRDPEVIGLPSFSNLAASLINSSAVNLIAEDHGKHVDALVSMSHITDVAGLEEAIKYAHLLLISIPPVDQFAHLTAFKLGDLRYLAFIRTADVNHLNDSITTYRDLLSMPGALWIHFRSIQRLLSTLSSRFELFEDEKDIDEMFRLFAVAVNDSYTAVPSRFKVAFSWAMTARVLAHPSITAAYEIAFSLMQDSLSFAPTLEIQHFRLVAMRDAYEQLPLNYASHLVHIGQIGQAVETLERRRGLLFSGMCGQDHEA